MVFLVELYLKKRRAKIVAWEKARDQWIADDEYGYRDSRDWERIHPYPVKRWGKIIGNIVPFVVVVIIPVLAVFMITQPDSKHDNKKASVTQQCENRVKKGDSVGINYGDFKGSKGTIIRQTKDCAVDITLTDSTNTFDQCKKADRGNCFDTLENSKMLHVDSQDNIVKL